MSHDLRATNIDVSNSEGKLKLDWNDGHQSVYTLFGLRKNCPCVHCRGGHGNMNTFDRSLFFVDAPRHFEIEDIKQIGNHAIRIFWSDGHNNGMYQWQTLREMCPCEKCYPAQE